MEKSLEKLIDLALKNGASQAEVKANLTQGYGLTLRNNQREKQEKFTQKNYQLEVFKDGRSASIDSADFSDHGLIEASNKCVSLMQLSQADSGIELPAKKLMAKNSKNTNNYYSNPYTLDQAFTLLEQAERGLLATSDHIRSDATNFYYSVSDHYHLNSHGLNYQQKNSYYSIDATAIAEKKEQMETDNEYDQQMDAKDLANPEQIGHLAAKKALRKIDGRKIKTCKVPIIFSYEISSSLINHLLAAISGSNQYYEQSFYLKQLNHKVLPDYLLVWEDPWVEKSLNSFAIDAEGLEKQKQFFIQDGVIEKYALSHFSATKLKMKHTANAGGFSNIYAQVKNPISFSQMLKQMGSGLIVNQLMGSSINPVTGDYSRGASGFWVENGIISYPVKEITIAGNLKNMYQNIISIASDVDLRKRTKVGSILIEQMTIAGH